AGNISKLFMHCPFERPHKGFVGVYFFLARLVSSYFTSAGNVFSRMLKVEGVQG
ncbi:hypothetical protein MKW98_010016, partial [Papaver atlanticum]